MTIFAVNKKGKGKMQCDDRIVIDDIVICEDKIFLENQSSCIIGIADGVGGNCGGNDAAQFICEKISQISLENIVDCISNINNDLLKYSLSICGKEHMASTFSGIVFNKNKIIHIGNTRVYSFQGKYLKQLTEDQTTYNRLMSMGLTDEALACNKSEISSCFGGGKKEFFKPAIYDYRAGNGFMITSDGIHDYIDVDTMEGIVFSSNDLPKISETLFNTALQNGSHDDMSIIIAYM